MKVALFLMTYVALTHAQGESVLKYIPTDVVKNVPASLIEGAEKIKDTVQAVIKGQEEEKQAPKKPAFCNDLDCPNYEVKEKTKDYELRSYGKSAWVQTAAVGIDYKAAQYDMFMKLFRYISGSNVDKKKIEMTVPVIVRIIPGQGPACENNFTMAFFVSPKEGTPPKALDNTVSVIELPSLTAYVSSFGGFANQDKYIKAALALGEVLDNEKKTYEKSYFYTAGYDAPFKLFNRHNEVWLLA